MKSLHCNQTNYFFLLFKLPYLGSISHHIEKELHQYTKANIPDSKLRFIHTTNKLKNHFHFEIEATPASPY